MIRKFLSMTALGVALALPATAHGALLYSFETGLEGWGPSGFNTGVTPPTVGLSSIGATDGVQAMEVVHNAGGQFSWNASTVIDATSDPARNAILSAASGDAANQAFEYDVTIDSANVPDTATFYGITFSFQSDAGFGQVDNVVAVDGLTSGTFHVVTPLTSLSVVPIANSGFYRLTFAQNMDTPRGAPSVFIDNIQITPEPASLGLLAMGGLGVLAKRRRA